MTTEEQINANKKNALKSTGPIDTSKTRFNAVKHAILSNKFLFEDKESKKEFEELLQRLILDYEPETIGQMALVEEFAITLWKKKRIEIFTNLKRQIDVEELDESPFMFGDKTKFKDTKILPNILFEDHFQKYQSHQDKKFMYLVERLENIKFHKRTQIENGNDEL